MKFSSRHRDFSQARMSAGQDPKSEVRICKATLPCSNRVICRALPYSLSWTSSSAQAIARSRPGTATVVMTGSIAGTASGARPPRISLV